MTLAKVLVRLKILPDDVNVKPAELASYVEGKLPEGASIRARGEEPIAFGLEALLLDVEVEEAEGAMDRLEEAIGKADHVSQIQVVGVSRLSTTLK